MKLLRLNLNCRLKCALQQIISLKISCMDIFVKVAKKIGRVGMTNWQCRRLKYTWSSLFNIAHGYSCFAQLTYGIESLLYHVR